MEDDENEQLFEEYEDAIQDLADKYRRKGLSHSDIVGGLQLRLMAIKEGGDHDAGTPGAD